MCQERNQNSTDFNPRSPRGERPPGRTFKNSCVRNVNPRSPRGERHIRRNKLAYSFQFQSTLPARGATMREAANEPVVEYFNPRSPRGERQFKPCDSKTLCKISIHAPREGSDGRMLMEAKVRGIFQSTLPARGATTAEIVVWERYNDFNPRSPRGERHALICDGAVRSGFQSTLPARGATSVHLLLYDVPINISIHAPREGSDINSLVTYTEDIDFNPRSPRGERPFSFVSGASGSKISIHAPREGSDFTTWPDTVSE